MKTVLQINICLRGSTGTITDNIGQMAIDSGWKSYIAYGRNDRKSKLQKIKIGNKLDIYWHVLITRLFDRHGFASKRATKKLIEQIKEIKPDIIHLHNIHGYYINIEMLFDFLAKENVPVVWTLHDCWVMTGHCSHFDEINCNKWQSQCYQCPLRKGYPASLLMDNSRNNYLAKKNLFTSVENITIVPVSHWLGNIVQKSFLHKYPLQVINNGIDINTFYPQYDVEQIRCKYKLQDKFVILGVSGVWNKSKGLDDFLLLNNELDNKEYQIALIGLNKKQVESLPKSIIGIAHTENIDELVKLYSIADVFVNPTYNDTFPTTNLEALACGTPVITYNTGGSVESVSKETGLIVEKGNINSLVDAIKEIQAKGKLFYSENCRKRAVEFFNKDDRYKEYIELYNKLLGYK